jgi:hypothetical protein
MTHTIEDLIASAVGQRPMDFEQTFVSLMMDKAGDAVEARKTEVAKTMFNRSFDEPVAEVPAQTEE